MAYNEYKCWDYSVVDMIYQLHSLNFHFSLCIKTKGKMKTCNNTTGTTFTHEKSSSLSWSFSSMSYCAAINKGSGIIWKPYFARQSSTKAFNYTKNKMISEDAPSKEVHWLKVVSDIAAKTYLWNSTCKNSFVVQPFVK